MVTRTVVVLAYEGVQALDLVGPAEVFDTATLLLPEGDGYDVVVASPTGQPLRTSGALTFHTCPLPEPGSHIDTLIIPGGAGAIDHSTGPDCSAWLADERFRSTRIATVCTGAFLAAEAGLLDGLPATTHWALADELRRRYPAVEVDPSSIFCRSSEKIWTSAGVSSGIDLALALVEDDHDQDIAQSVAQWLVLYRRRSGFQSQFAPPVWTPRARSTPVRAAQEYIEADPSRPCGVPDLAGRAGMSERHFTRLFTAEVGIPPGRYVEKIRVDIARAHLETSSDTNASIATRCGFRSAEVMRRAFLRSIGIPPDTYRQSFAQTNSPIRAAALAAAELESSER